MTTPYYQDDTVTLWLGDALDVLRGLPDGSVDCCVTSPPYYGLRDYGVEGQYGLEDSPAEYVARMVAVFAQVRRVLADDGTLWLNIGDSYVSKPPGNVRGVSDRSGLHGAQTSEKYRDTLTRGTGTKRDTTGFGLSEKNLIGVPWRVAFALQDDGWTLRNAVIWHKPNAMPESVTDRLSTRYEHLFLLSKSRRYWFDLDAIREPLAYPEAADGTRVFGGGNKADALTIGSSARRTGNRYGAARAGRGSSREQSDNHEAADPRGRNPGDVWTITTSPFPGAHFACMPLALAERCVTAGCKPDGVVLDPFSGSGTTGLAAQRLGPRYVGIDLSRDYLDLSLRTRLRQATLDFGEATG